MRRIASLFGALTLLAGGCASDRRISDEPVDGPDPVPPPQVIEDEETWTENPPEERTDPLQDADDLEVVALVASSATGPAGRVRVRETDDGHIVRVELMSIPAGAESLEVLRAPSCQDTTAATEAPLPPAPREDPAARSLTRVDVQDQTQRTLRAYVPADELIADGYAVVVRAEGTGMAKPGVSCALLQPPM